MKWLLVALALVLAGCVTQESSVPLYPSDWPALVISGEAKSCPDISGTYRAVSEPVGPLVYPKGGAPSEEIFFVPLGDASTPKLGRRVLPWQLAERPSKEERASLASFDYVLRPDAAHPDGKVDLGWVRIARADNGRFSVECGIDDKVMCAFMLEPAPPQSPLGRLLIAPGGYVIDEGALTTCCWTTTSEMEHGRREYWGSDQYYRNARGYFTFYRAADGSLVMVEDLFYERSLTSGSICHKKWWRWRRIG